MNESEKLVDQFFKTNQTPSAFVRADEEALVANDGPGPVELRIVARQRWDSLLNKHVTVPDAVRNYIARHPEGEPFTTEEVQDLEIAVEKYHGITEPFYVHMDIHLQQTGRTWMFVPEAVRFQSGFVLGKE